MTSHTLAHRYEYCNKSRENNRRTANLLILDMFPPNHEFKLAHQINARSLLIRFLFNSILSCATAKTHCFAIKIFNKLIIPEARKAG